MSLKDELIDGIIDTATEKTYHLVAEGEITEEQANEIIHMVLQGDWVEASQLLEHYKEQEEVDESIRRQT